MSGGKWLICDSIMINKLEEIKDRLKEDIKKDKEESKGEESWNTFPYEGLFTEINELQTQHKKSFVETDRCFHETYDLSFSEHLDKHFPHWKHLYDKSYIEKRDKEWEEVRDLDVLTLEERREVKDKHFPYGYFMNKEVQ
jgi:hypothetical protein|tara:strand:+ start:508 stop:927 length:420 start_codon:yes stop_codon:yes gene_type:complete